MSSLERNKVFAAVLLAGLIAMLTGFFARVTVAPDEPGKPAYQVASTQAVVAASDVKPLDPIAPMLATADPAAGEKYAKVCAACHSFGKGEPAKVGPNLYGIVNNKHAHMEGYAYSDAMKAQQGPWDYQTLAVFLANPRAAVPGTKMGFAGIHSEKDEANVIVWLRSLSDDPAPMPK